jgi:hypothetical protein
MRTSDDRQHAEHPDVVVGRGSERDDGLSGFVILRLLSGLDPGEGPDLREHAEALRLRSLVNYLDELGGPPTRRAITSVAPRKLLQQEKEAKDSPLPPLRSLTSYWRIDAHELRQPLEEIAARFSRLDDVEFAYAEMAVSDPAASTPKNPLNGEQLYLNAAPNGIGARWAWNQPGGKGQGVGLADIEAGWRLNHKDLLRPDSTLIHITVRDKNGHPVDLINLDGTGFFVGDHGTAVLGIIAARDNKLGVIGIAPSLRKLRVAPISDGTNTVDVGNALIAASEEMRVGDVLLLEVAREGPKEDRWPTEIDDLDFDAIRHVTNLGRIVVEAAANAGMNLADWPGQNGRRLVSGQPDWDSGAIMVGACQTDPHPLVDISRERYSTSNYGERVNCFAWGQWATTCWVAPPGLTPMPYTRDFTGTSSAAAIVAAATVLSQSMNIARRPGEPVQPRRAPLWPLPMRSILSDHNNGTPQGPLSAAKNEMIGSMPDLKKIKTNELDHIPLP